MKRTMQQFAEINSPPYDEVGTREPTFSVRVGRI